MIQSRKQAGFTLIEILVVILIISIATTVALLSIGHNQNHRLESFANEMAQLITLAEEQAMLRPAVLGLQVESQRYFFAVYQPDADPKKKEPPWKTLEDDRTLAKHIIPDDLDVSVQIKNGANDAEKAEETQPQIVLSTNGDLTPFAIYVGKHGQQPRYEIRGDADGSVKVKKLF